MKSIALSSLVIAATLALSVQAQEKPIAVTVAADTMKADMTEVEIRKVDKDSKKTHHQTR